MTTETPAGSSRAVELTVVASAACHLCSDADEALAELAPRHHFVVRKVDVNAPEGQALIRLHRPPMTPLVLLDGMFFSSGRLPRRKLAKALEQRRRDEHPQSGVTPPVHARGGLHHG